MKKLTEIANAIGWINVVFAIVFVILFMASISYYNNDKEAYSQVLKYIFILGIVGIILDIVWTAIGLFTDVSITLPIVSIVIWIFICLFFY